jgi:hypothetical protein
MPRRSFKHQHSSHYLAVCDKNNPAAPPPPPPHKKSLPNQCWEDLRLAASYFTGSASLILLTTSWIAPRRGAIVSVPLAAARTPAPPTAGRNLTEKPRKRFSPFDFSLSPTSAFTALASGSRLKRLIAYHRLLPFSQRLSSGAALVNAAPLLQAPAFLALLSGLRQKEPCQRLSTIAAPLVPLPASFAVGRDSR